MTRGSLTLKPGQLTPEIMLNPEYDENITSNSFDLQKSFRTISLFLPNYAGSTYSDFLLQIGSAHTIYRLF